MFFGVPSRGWSSNISVSDYILILYIVCHIHITSIRSPTVMSPDASSGFHTSQVYRHQHCVPRRPFDQMPCHTHGGLDTYHSLSVNVSSDYFIHQMLLHIHASHYYRRTRAEMCLCLIELTWSLFPSFHTSQCYESLPVCKHWIIWDSIIT